MFFDIPVPNEIYMDYPKRIPPDVLKEISERMIELLKLEEKAEELRNSNNPKYWDIVGRDKVSNIIRKSHEKHLEAIFEARKHEYIKDE